MLTELLGIFAKITIILATGYVFTKKNVITREMKRNLSTLLVDVVLYFNIISSSQQEMNTAYLKGFIQVLIIFIIYYFISIFAMHKMVKHFSLSEKSKNVFITMAVFANVAFIGFSMMGELLGEEGTLYTIAVNVAFQLFFYSYGIYLLSRESGEKKAFDVKSIFLNEVLFVSISAVVLYLLPFRFPAFLQSTLSTVGSIMMPLSMLIIGAEIAEMDLKEILKDPYSYIISFLRLIFFPMLMLAVGKLLHLSESVALTLVVLSALPSGSMNVIMAQRYDCDPEFATRSVAQSMLFMVVTLPIVVGIAKLVL